jgi:hypothetical protein
MRRGRDSAARFLITGTILLTIALSPPARSQQVTQVAGVDNTNMGAYRALAHLSFDAFEQGDLAMAAKLARILERAWDKGEEGNGRFALEGLNPALFKEIDDAMDAYIKPILYSQERLNAKDATDKFNNYMKKLELGDKLSP